MLLPDAFKVVCDGADRQPPDQGKVGAEQDEDVWLGGQTDEVEVPTETSEEFALTGPITLGPSGD